MIDPNKILNNMLPRKVSKDKVSRNSADDVIGPFKTKSDAEKEANRISRQGGGHRGGVATYVVKEDNEYWVELRYER